MPGQAAIAADLNAVSEDRTHDLRIMRPTRCQLRYHRLCLRSTCSRGSEERSKFSKCRLPFTLKETLLERARARSARGRKDALGRPGRDRACRAQEALKGQSCAQRFIF